MPAPYSYTILDLRRMYYETVSSDDTDVGFFRDNSGLTPKEKYSFTDHELAFLRNNHKPYVGGAGTVTARNLITKPKPADVVGMQVGGSTAIITAPWNATRNCIQATPDGINTPYVFSVRDTPSFKQGDVVTFFVKVWVTSPNPTIEMAIQVRIQTGNVYLRSDGSTGIQYVPTTTGIFIDSKSSIILDRDINAGELNIAVVWRRSTGALATVDDKVAVGDFLMVKGNYTGSYFDGDSAHARWTGTAHASTSELVDQNSIDIVRLEYEYFSNNSGLTPRDKFTLADHEYHYYRTQLGL